MATENQKCKHLWREASPPNYLGDEVDPDQLIDIKSLFLSVLMVRTFSDSSSLLTDVHKFSETNASWTRVNLKP